MKEDRILRALRLNPDKSEGNICVRADRTVEYVKNAVVRAFRETADFEIDEDLLEVNFKPYNFRDDLFASKEDLKAVEISYRGKFIDNYILIVPWSEVNEDALGYIHYNAGRDIEENPDADWSWLEKQDKEHLESKVFLDVMYYPS